ncbi:MAG: zinc metallopeptidase [Saprospiraceae bacterium]|nr:zinc metallopeptidase [Saprospiraceae bacterium]
MGLIVISLIFTGIGMLISGRLKSKFAKYSLEPLQSGLSGQEVARQMLNHYGITDVQIVQGEGMLTDHYNPQTKTVSLSPEVYQGRHIASAAVAAHECGHAVQHATAYSMLQMRSALVPVVQISSSLQKYLFMLGIVGMASFNSPIILLIAIGAFAVTTIFSLVTLPVEFDASKRALVWLDETNVTRGAEYDGAKDALTWAAMTYVAAALAALVQLLYLVFMFLGRRE